MMGRWLIAVLLIAWSPVLAAGEHSRSVDEIVGDILVAQEVSEQEQIDCAEVNEEQFDELGDALMGTMIGNDEQHEIMDNMMGGEGSDSLREMHVNIGQRYLGCGDSIGQMGMMGGGIGMMNSLGDMMGLLSSGSGVFQGGDSSMMGNISGIGSTMGLGGGMLMFWVLVILAIIGLYIVWFNRKKNVVGSSKTALDILKERYAKGEIDKDEFETKKKDLT